MNQTPIINKEIKGNQFLYTYLEKETIIAKIGGVFIVPNELVVLRQKSGPTVATNALRLTFVEDFRKMPACVIQVPNVPARKAMLDWLYEVGFKIKYKKYLYFKDLKTFDYQPTALPPFTFKSLADADPSYFKKCLFEAAEGDPTTDTATSNPQKFFDELADYPTFDPNHWQMVYLNENLIGFITAKLIPEGEPNEVEGNIQLFAIMPAFRQKGLGKHLHYRAMGYLKEIGATIYFGSTAEANVGMVKIFKQNVGEMEREQLFLGL